MELLLVIVYTIIVTTIGYLARHNKSDDDFVMGLWRIDQLGTTMTIFATLVSESVIFFSVALTVLYGAWGCIAASAGPSLALLLMSILAQNARFKGATDRLISNSDYCRKYWGKGIGRLAEIVFLVLLAWVVILQIKVNSDLISGMLNWSPIWSTIFSVGVVLFYLVCGGYRAVIRTDIFQGVLLFVFLILPLFISPRPNIKTALDTKLLSTNVLLLFLMSFALTITRPELWQRIYSSINGKIAARSLRLVALFYILLGCMLFYYAISVIQAGPNLSPSEAFAKGYRIILPQFLAALFPVLLMAALMSTLDSAAFLLSVNLTSLSSYFIKNRMFWSRIFIGVLLIGSGLISLTIFNALTFAYKINGIVALLAIPLLLSSWVIIPRYLLGMSLTIGFLIYIAQVMTGRIDRNPSEAVIPALVVGIVLVSGYLLIRSFNNIQAASEKAQEP